ncbi:MAG: zf-HC2 domain-containing protein [Deltaproteobacteria bacterium]|nr:zf-HC2 domain-containing protein [Deltaproteobacteria bacterium]
MKCSNIKLLLSEYIDKSLNVQTRSLVEQHLKDCETCQNDYVVLKNIISDLGELPKVKAPDDFLDNLHARMDSRFDIKKIARTLFVPFKIKVPLELLTAAATAVLIIFFVNVFQQERPLTDLLYNQKAERLNDTSLPADKFGATATRQPSQDKGRLEKRSVGGSQLKEKQAEKESSKVAVSKVAKGKDSTTFTSAPAPVAEETRAGYLEKKELEKPIELALLLDTEGVYKPDATFADNEKKDQKLSETISEPKLKRKMSASDFAALKASTDADSKTPLKPGSAKKMNGVPTKPEKEEEGSALESVAEVAAPVQSIDERIKAIIQNNSGRVISVNYDEQKQLPVSIMAEIPSSRIKSFYSQLSHIGRLKQPLPVIDETTTEPLRVNILLISTP